MEVEGERVVIEMEDQVEGGVVIVSKLGKESGSLRGKDPGGESESARMGLNN
jgi:hypothetical protein